MSDQQLDHVDRYLWDPAADPDEDVRALERLLAAGRFDPVARPWSPPAARRSTAVPWRWSLPIAAGIVLAVGAFGLWRWTWPAGHGWTVVGPAAPSVLGVGETLRVPPSGRALVNVARIGTMQVRGGSAVTLHSTRSNYHVLTLGRGSVRVRVWAPPASIVFRTPGGEVIDLGCEFELEVIDATARVRVTSGWVQLENQVDETLVPAGASTEMTDGLAPGTAVFDDAATGFLDAVRQLERGRREAVEQVVRLARPRDVFTLLMLVERRVERYEEIAARAAELWPPPKGITVVRIVRGDREAIWRWRDALPLPPTKWWWWLNWQDGLPSWLVGTPG